MAGTPITSVPYIGDSTERNLRKKLSNRPTGNIGKAVSINEATRHKNKSVVEYHLDKRQLKELRKADATPKARQRMERRENRDGPAETNTTNVGDFRVTKDDRKEAWNAHQDRSAVSQEQDEERRARITTDVERWKSDKDSFDFPGIDTPGRKPRRQDKDRDFVASDSLLRPFESDTDDDDDDDMDSIIPGI